MADEDVNAGIPAPEGAAGIIDTDYEIGQDNIETQIGPFGLDVHNPVFLISGLSVVVGTRAGRHVLWMAAPGSDLDL
jgi:BCCT family betaine/carnitine transporter